MQRAALEALLRRAASARREGLKLAARPSAPLGAYQTAREGAIRPYRMRLASLEPFRGSCDCRDYLRSSLGLCKHLFAAAEELAKRGILGKVRELAARPAPPGLSWDPVRPLTGLGDWLERLRWDGEPSGPLEREQVQRCFRADGRLKASFLERPARRLELVRDLERLAAGPALAGAADPAIAPLLAAEVERLSRAADGCTAPELRRWLSTLKLPLYPYQREGVRRFLETGRLLLADDMGLGKTAQAIASAHALVAAGKVKRGLLVVPAALKPQWLREWQQFTDVPVAIVEGGAAERQRIYRRCRAGFLIVNYEQVLRDLPWMQRFSPELVVLDEAQRIKNWETKTSAQVKRLSPRYRLVLTGTPMENRLEELASLLEWIDDQALEPKWRLGPWHSVQADGARDIVGARHLDTLRARLSGSLLRRLRREVLSQLPSRTDTQIPVALTGPQQARHDELNEPIARLVGAARRRPLTQAEFLRLMSLFTTQRMICNGLAQSDFEEVWPALSASPPTEPLLQGLSSPKLLELRELVSNVAVAQERKIVVFSQWRRMLRLAQWATSDLLLQAGLRSVFFTGEEGQKRRTQNLVDFHDDPKARILFASDAGGVGLNLQRAASCCVNLELPWNPAVLEQRIGRVYRLGQSNPVEVYCLVSQPGIEERIAALVGDKKALFSGLFDGQSDEVAFARSGSFLSRIEKVVAEVPPPAPRAELPAEPQGDDGTTDLRPESELGDAPPDTLPSAGPALVAPSLAAPPATESRPSLGADEIRGLFSRLDVRPGPAGRVTFEAPPEVAASLAALFEGMARMLGSRP
ncbi:MAG: DEAD/DEAH box helicase [Deltaproteobacteria bacterium]